MRRMLITAMCGTLALSTAACGGDSSGAGSDRSKGSGSGLRVATVYAGSITASGWDRDGAAAIESMSKALDADSSSVESVAYDKAAPTFDRLANQGYKVVIAHSSGFEPAILEVAPNHPDTQFVLFSDISTTEVPDNVAAWKINWNELGYLVGTAMCTISTTGIVGHVSSAPIPAFTRLAGGLEQATEEEGTCKDQNDPLKITFTGSFTDAALAKSAALAMIGEGASVLSDGADAAGEAVVATATEKGIPYVGGLFDVGPSGPETVATSIPIDFAAAYGELGDLLAADNVAPGGIYDVSVESGGLSYVAPVENVSNANEVAKALDDAIARIKDGSLEVDPTREVKG